MTAFWIGGSILTALAVLIVWMPFFRRTKATSSGLRESVNVQLFRQQSELAERLFGDSDNERSQAEALKQELALSLLQDAQSEPDALLDKGGVSLWVPALMTVLVLGLPIGAYVTYDRYSPSVEFVHQGATRCLTA